MNGDNKKTRILSRRHAISLLGSGFLFPLFTNGNEGREVHKTIKSEQEHTLLKPDGTVVKLKPDAFHKVKVIKSNISNRSLRVWLDRYNISGKKSRK